jgi:hypothetical protein
MDMIYDLVKVSLLHVCLSHSLRYLQEPVNSYGPLNTTNYTPKGSNGTIGEMAIHTVGSGKNALIYIYDITP